MPEAKTNLGAPDQTIGTSLTFAVNLIDSYSDRHPIGNIKVSVVDREITCVKNPSGYYVFTGLPRENYRVRIQSDFYFEEEAEVEVSHLDRLNPVWDIRLNPLPAYPFPPGANLIRGMVYDRSGARIPGALLQIKGKVYRNSSTPQGEYVLYFKYRADDTGMIDEEKRKHYIFGDEEVRIAVTALEHGKKETILEQIHEGATTKIDLYFI
jgi:hypothetical protein